MDAIAKAAYQTEWAKQNKVPPKNPDTWMYLVPAAVWAVCIIVFLSGFQPGLVPDWVTNVAWGGCILLWGLVFLLAALMTLTAAVGTGVMMKLSVNVDMAESVEDRENVKEVFARRKGEMATKFLYELSTWGKVKVALLFLQAGLLYAGQAYFTGTVLLVGFLYIYAALWFERQAVRTTVEKVVEPTKLAWLETRVLTPDEVKVEQINEFETRVEKVGKLLPPKK